MAYHDLYPARLPAALEGLKLLTKPGVRGFPGVDPAQALLVRALLERGDLEPPLLDLTAMSGLAGVALAALEPTLVERSRAALNVLEAQRLRAVRGVPDELEGEYGTVVAVLPAEKGNDAVEEVLSNALRLTRPGGTCFLAGDKDKGFERYFKWARDRFGEGEIFEREKGLRVAGFRKLEAAGTQERDLSFSTYPLDGLTIAALPGVFSRGGLDAATGLLLEHLPDPAGLRVLDLGAGAGVLSAWAAARGAAVTALEDDWGAVLSTRETLRRSALEGEVLHSDVTSALGPGARFDLAVSNPPFHVGSDLMLDVAEAFIEAASRHLEPGGNFYLVANVFLAYERGLERHFRVREVARTRSFKVLAGQKR